MKLYELLLVLASSAQFRHVMFDAAALAVYIIKERAKEDEMIGREQPTPSLGLLGSLVCWAKVALGVYDDANIHHVRAALDCNPETALTYEHTELHSSSICSPFSVGYSRSAACAVVAIRGTVTLREWISNAAAVPTQTRLLVRSAAIVHVSVLLWG